jgi:hypothetical protein
VHDLADGLGISLIFFMLVQCMPGDVVVRKL